MRLRPPRHPRPLPRDVLSVATGRFEFVRAMSCTSRVEGSVGRRRRVRTGGPEADDPGAVADLVAGVGGLVVGGAVVPQGPEDLHPPLSEAAEGGGVAHAVGLLL